MADAEEKKEATEEESKQDAAPDADKEEKKSDEQSEKVNIDSGESAELEHEVTHLDQVTVDVDIRKTSGSQRRLMIMVIVTVILLAAGGFGFVLQLEGGKLPKSTGNVTVQTEEETEEKPVSMVAYAIDPGAKSLKTFTVEGEKKEAKDISKTISAQNTNEGDFMLSTSGQAYAIKTAAETIYVRHGEKENTFTIKGLVDWLMAPDGTRLYALSGANLHEYDTITGQGGEVAKNFALAGDASHLLAARDGSIRMYSKAGTSLSETTYSTLSKKVESRKANLPRLDILASMRDATMAPDGSSLVFMATISGRNTLQLISLNSFVMRTVFVNELAGGAPESLSWSEDSNNIAINVSGSGKVQLVNLKVGTLEKDIVLEQNGSGSRFNKPRWSPDEKYISFVQDGKVKAAKLEDKSVVDLIDSVGANAYTGWYQD